MGGGRKGSPPHARMGARERLHPMGHVFIKSKHINFVSDWKDIGCFYNIVLKYDGIEICLCLKIVCICGMKWCLVY